MKKLFIVLTILFTSTLLFANGYQIKEIKYNLNPSSWKFLGCTNQYVLEQNVPVDTKKIFLTLDEFKTYYNDYVLRLSNTRAFETLNVNYTVEESKDDTPSKITITVETVDSVHLLAVPYPKYNSNDGLKVSIKAKDTNFLGSLNTMTTDINFILDENRDVSFGFNFAFDYPFKAGLFDVTWVNDYGFNWTIGYDTPEWDTKTGLKFVLPKDRIAYQFEFYQSFNKDYDYALYDDEIYFNEDVIFSLPVKLYTIPNFSDIQYKPYIEFSANWDSDGINPVNTNLSSPSLTFGHSISLGRANWKDNLRTGVSASISNDYTYNFQRKLFYPSLSTEIKAYKGIKLFDNKYDIFNKIGLCADLYSSFLLIDFDNPYFGNDGTNVGSRLRGILDNQTTTDTGWYACESPAVITLNLDFPFHLFSTNFDGRIMKYFNFDLQISPFIDMALMYNKSTQNWFNLKDGFYSAGIEFLVYPAKWSSFTVRGSLGFDIGRKFFRDMLNTEWRDDVSYYELSIGIGLHY